MPRHCKGWNALLLGHGTEALLFAAEAVRERALPLAAGE